MRRLWMLIPSFLVVACLLGCNPQAPSSGTSVNFYYIHNDLEFGTDTPLLVKTTRTVSTEDSSLDAVVKLYLNGPTSYDCISPFPGGTELVEIYVDGDKANIVLSPHIGTLSPAKQTIAYACLTKTVTEFAKVTTVQLRLENSLINGAETASFTVDSFALLDTMKSNNIIE